MAKVPLEAVLTSKAHATMAAPALQSCLGLCSNFRERLCASGIPVLGVGTQFSKLALGGHIGTLL